MNLIWLFCIYMTFIYLPYDLFFKPVAVDQEVWFGFMLTGWAAKLTAPLHWAIYAAGAYGFWKMRWWMWPLGRPLRGADRVGHGDLEPARPPAGGLWLSVVSMPVMAVPAIALWRSKAHFARSR